MTTLTKPHSIAIFAYPGVQMSAVLGLADLFSIANRYTLKHGEATLYITEINKETLATTPSTFDAVILPPNLTGSRGENETSVHQWLQARHSEGTVICSVCAGAFWLGHSGLLKGRPATTHWLLGDVFRTTFPETELHCEHLLIDDNDIVTAGGLMAWLDLGLYVVNRWLGPHVVSKVARHLLIDPSGREQRNYRSFQPPLNHGDDIILKLQHWLEANSKMTITISSLAAQSCLSQRTFLRRFKAATGYTPNSYLQNLRMEKARGLLERMRIPISEIGWRVGYQDPSAFSRIFKTTTGLSAGEYRNRFGVYTRNMDHTQVAPSQST